MSEHSICLCLFLGECYFLKKYSVTSFSLAGFVGYGFYMESMGLKKQFSCFRERMLNGFIYAWECFANENNNFRKSFK